MKTKSYIGHSFNHIWKKVDEPSSYFNPIYASDRAWHRPKPPLESCSTLPYEGWGFECNLHNSLLQPKKKVPCSWNIKSCSWPSLSMFIFFFQHPFVEGCRERSANVECQVLYKIIWMLDWHTHPHYLCMFYLYKEMITSKQNIWRPLSSKSLVPVLMKLNPRVQEKIWIKVSAYLYLGNEWVENDIRSLCTNSRGLVACKAFPLGK